MAISLNQSISSLSTAGRIVYTCPTGKGAIIFDGTISNKDSTTKQGQLVTVEIQKTTGTIYTLVKDMIIPYGISIRVPKYTLLTGDKLLMTASSSNVDVILSIAEKS